MRLVIRHTIAACMIACSWTIAGKASRWVAVGKTADAVRSVDADEIVRDKAVATIWLKTEYSRQGPSGEAVAIEKWMHDCGNGRLKLLAFTLYQANGSVIVSAERPRYAQRWDQVVTGTIGDEIHQSVCGTEDSNPDGEQRGKGSDLNVS